MSVAEACNRSSACENQYHVLQLVFACVLRFFFGEGVEVPSLPLIKILNSQLYMHLLLDDRKQDVTQNKFTSRPFFIQISLRRMLLRMFQTEQWAESSIWPAIRTPDDPIYAPTTTHRNHWVRLASMVTWIYRVAAEAGLSHLRRNQERSQDHRFPRPEGDRRRILFPSNSSCSLWPGSFRQDYLLAGPPCVQICCHSFQFQPLLFCLYRECC